MQLQMFCRWPTPEVPLAGGQPVTDQTRPTVLKLIKKLKSNGYNRKVSPAALGLEATPLENPGYASGPAVLSMEILVNNILPKS